MPLRVQERVPIPATADAIPTLIDRAQSQARPTWCWAACAAMIMRRPKDDQCLIAGMRLNSAACCGLPQITSFLRDGQFEEPTDCDRPIAVAELELLWDELHVPAVRVDRRLTEQELHELLDTNHPVQVWQGGDGRTMQHVLLVVGHRNGSLAVADPFFPGETFAVTTYDELKGQRGGWQRTFALR